MFQTMKHRQHNSNKPRRNKGPNEGYSKDRGRNERPKGDRPEKPRTERREHEPRPESGEKARGPRASLYGFHAVREAWLNPERKIHALYINEQSVKGFEETIKEGQTRGLRRPHPVTVEKQKLDSMLPKGAVHQGIALACAPLDDIFVQDMVIAAGDKPNVTIVMLDQVTDPHNVGAILRSASAFGASGMVLQKRHAPEMDGVLAKSACGAVEHVPVAYETNLSRAIEEFKEAGFFVFGFDEHTNKSIRDIKPGGKVVLVLGSEGDGIRRLVKEHCDELLKLPTDGPIQSLNVSNAAAIALYALGPKR
ncbi:MAG: 23S rRNA (guanosine(2251)-2'-O)-methyltransferase RlmB [Micavibrio sp.]|nr:23S rRNA (guanosine(2251)-2'-O)-methyltransferase RlmB [Micavibrio sp.]MBK9562122.1 23S rRNA (guanosine(2251)-2'-O)-methyltransferase RlmB [Micavibrio sp.]